MEQQTKLQDSITVYENIKGNYDVRKNACSESELMNRFRYLGWLIVHLILFMFILFSQGFSS